VVVIGAGVVAAMSIATGVSPWFGLVLGAIFVMGVGDGASLVAEQGIMQRRTPDAVRSRVSGAFDSVVHVGMAASYVVAGPAVAWLGARGVYIVGGAAAMIGVAVALPVLRIARESSARLDLTEAPAEPAEATTLLVP